MASILLIRPCHFGIASSCKIFEEVATTLDWAVTNLTKEDISHYLDDFFFYHASRETCLKLLKTFQSVSDYINFPISHEKTFFPAQILDFLGIEIDTVNMVLRVPPKKVLKAKEALNQLLSQRRCKIRQLQSLWFSQGVKLSYKSYIFGIVL